MTRTFRLAGLTALALLLAAAGAVVAVRAPDATGGPAPLAQDGDETPPTAEELAHAADRLAANDLEVADEVLSELAGQYGLGGAVRIVAWSDGNADRMARIREMRDGDGTEGSEMGWGQVAKELGEHPGIGSIMGQGGGHGRDDAPGQQNRDGTNEDSGD
jgi:hypothetical protein